MKCPNCKGNVHYSCNRSCICQQGIPDGELCLKDFWLLLGHFHISRKLGGILFKLMFYLNAGYWIDKLWYKLFKKIIHVEWYTGFHPYKILVEAEECPYCGYWDTFETWYGIETDEYDQVSDVGNKEK